MSSLPTLKHSTVMWIILFIGVLMFTTDASASPRRESPELAKARDRIHYKRCRDFRYQRRQPPRVLCHSFVAGTHQARVPRRWASQPAMLELIFHESGWSQNAVNRSSGACGWAQALPCSKAPRWGVGHAAWMLKYVAGRYGTPRHALQTWWNRSPHWY